MSKTNKVLGALAILAIVSIVGFTLASVRSVQSEQVATLQAIAERLVPSLGGSSFYEGFPIHFGGGLFAGPDKELSIDTDGNVTTTGDLSVAAITATGALTSGGGVFATTSQGATTYTASDIENVGLIRHTASAALTATLPASSTFSSTFIPNAGDKKEVCLYAITTLITLAGGTGTEINTASSTKNVNAGGLGCLVFVRDSDTDIEVLMTTGS